MDKKMEFYKKIRILTAPPVLALVMLILVYCFRRNMFGGVENFILAVLFLVIFPILAYPLQTVMLYFREKGREGQRQFAIMLSSAGYAVGTILAVVCGVSLELKRIYLIYLFSGIFMLLFNKVIRVRASGHACGVMGAGISLFYSIGWPALCGILILAAAYRASLKMQRHTWTELLLGTMIPLWAAWVICVMSAFWLYS